MSRRLLTLRNGKVLTALWEDGRILECSIDERQPAFLDRIYVARVTQIVKSIEGAFLSIGNRKLYYSLKENPLPVFNTCKRPGCISEGDEMIVQVTREALKTKEACAGSQLQINGRYCVVLRDSQPGLHFRLSRKITDETWRCAAREHAESLSCIPRLRELAAQKDFGISILIRTNAYEVDREEMLQEIASCCDAFYNVLSNASYRSEGACLWQPLPAYVSAIRDTSLRDLETIVCDDEELLNEVKETLENSGCSHGLLYSLYSDRSYPMSKCYNLDSTLEKALNRQVWLSSGAYLIIEQTEALTAIDVNTGKAIGAYKKKESQDEYFFRINLEAAREIMYQLRLRNLSGMILVDFINMQNSGLQEALMEQLRQLALKDPVYTRIVDITKLGLVEITRKKLKEPLDKQLKI